MKLTLKTPGTKRLKLEYDGLLSNFESKYNLRRYKKVDALLAEPLLQVGQCNLTLSNPR
jgi:hypothetical protein